jgi:hypothetical protein
MINAKLNLVLLLLDEKTFNYKIVSLSDTSIVCPSVDIFEFQDIDESIRLLYKNYLMISEEQSFSFDYKLIDILIQDVLNIYYLTIISHDLENKYSYKIPIKKHEFNLPNLSKIIQRLS